MQLDHERRGHDLVDDLDRDRHHDDSGALDHAGPHHDRSTDHDCAAAHHAATHDGGRDLTADHGSGGRERLPR